MENVIGTTIVDIANSDVFRTCRLVRLGDFPKRLATPRALTMLSMVAEQTDMMLATEPNTPIVLHALLVTHSNCIVQNVEP